MSICPLCSAPMRPWFVIPGDWRHPKSDRSFDAVRCPSCGFGRIDPAPSPEVLADHYKIEAYYTRGRATAGELRISFLDRVRAKLAGWLDRGMDQTRLVMKWAPLASGRVLEIGSGGGKVLRLLKDAGYDVTGVEPDANAASRQDGLHVLAGTAEQLPAEIMASKFDYVILQHVIEHCADPVKVAQNIRAVLKPGGVVLVEAPNIDCLDFRMGKLTWPHLGVPRHLLFWNRATLSRLFTQSGFDVASVQYVGLQRQFLPWWIAFGSPMLPYYRERGGFQRAPKDLGAIYYWLLLAAMPFVPRRMRYDSVCLVLRRT